MAESVCCPTCWTWSKLQKVTTCQRCGTPLILPDGRRVGEEVNAPASTVAVGPTHATLLVATQDAARSSGAGPATPIRNPLIGIAGGVGAAILGAALWAGTADVTHYRLGLVGVAIGWGVAFVFTRFGLRGATFAMAAAALTVGGCALGDVGAGTLILSSRAGIGPGTVLMTVPIGKLMNVDALDALFYALAAYAAFRRVARSVPTTAADAVPTLMSVTGPPGSGLGHDQSTDLLPPVAQPMVSAPSPLPGATSSRRTLAIRIAVLAVSVAITFWALSHPGTSRPSAFLAGDCVNTSSSSNVIASADCAGTHTARIDEVLSGSNTFCPPGDMEVLVKAPNPNLCMNFNDQKP